MITLNCKEPPIKKDGLYSPIGSGDPPDYRCLPTGQKLYLSREEKKDYLYGGACPKICPMFKGTCPDISTIVDTNQARVICNSDPNCTFINNSVLNRMGPNYCIVKNQGPDCIVLTENDLLMTDKQLTENICKRQEVGCVFNRGNGDGIHSRKGNPTCLRGCLGTKYWENPNYMWGSGGTRDNPFRGSYYNNDLKLGALYLEAAPSKNNPEGWGGGSYTPYNGSGKLPRSLGSPYTESKGIYSPPCNIQAGNVGAFIQQATGEELAGPGCILTPPNPRYGLYDWSYTCNCPYLADGGELRPDAWLPCADWEINQDSSMKRNICSGCYIQQDPKKKMYGHCILGEETQDTESKLIGCVRLPGEPLDKCRVKRIVDPTECPHFCSEDITDPLGWSPETQCAEMLSKECWKPNPAFKKILSKQEADKGMVAPPYIKGNNNCNVKDTKDLCYNCSLTPLMTVGSGTDYSNRAYCLVGGSEVSSFLDDPNYGKYMAKTLSCPPTCGQCTTGYFGDPMRPVYKLEEATNSSSAFNKGILYIPWIGTQAEKQFQIS